MAATNRRRVTAMLVTGTAAWNVFQNVFVPRRWYAPANLVGTALALGSAAALGLTATDLGLGPGAVRRGVRHAAVPSLLVVGAVAAGVAGRTRPLFRDERVEPATLRSMAHEVGFRIPIGTALFEETLFRGLLLGWYSTVDGEGAATVGSSVAFGMWHVLPTLETAAVVRSGRLRSSRRTTLATVAAGVVVTTLAGVGFSLLRRRSRSLVTPIAVHAVLNGAGYIAAWIEARDRLGVG